MATITDSVGRQANDCVTCKPTDLIIFSFRGDTRWYGASGIRGVGERSPKGTCDRYIGLVRSGHGERCTRGCEHPNTKAFYAVSEHKVGFL